MPSPTKHWCAGAERTHLPHRRTRSRSGPRPPTMCAGFPELFISLAGAQGGKVARWQGGGAGGKVVDQQPSRWRTPDGSTPKASTGPMHTVAHAHAQSPPALLRCARIVSQSSFCSRSGPSRRQPAARPVAEAHHQTAPVAAVATTDGRASWGPIPLPLLYAVEPAIRSVPRHPPAISQLNTPTNHQSRSQWQP